MSKFLPRRVLTPLSQVKNLWFSPKRDFNEGTCYNNLAGRLPLAKDGKPKVVPPQEFNPIVQTAFERVMMVNEPFTEDDTKVRGYDFNHGVDYEKVFSTYTNVGLQATFLGRAINVLNAMIDCKMEPIQQENLPSPGYFLSPGRPRTNCTIFLGYTSNMVSSGNREILRYLAEHNMVDCIVSTAGGIEEDIMKCWTPFYVGEFDMDGEEQFKKNQPRNGNVCLPGGEYRNLMRFLEPILDDMRIEQDNGFNWTPSKFIWEMGKKINHQDSILYWAYQHKIPVLSPALTDGAIGDILFFHSHKFPDSFVRLDIVQDIQTVIDLVLNSVNTGSLTLGSGIIKHHILNSNSFRNGLDYAVYVTTAVEYDGSDAGASPEEAVSWGKISYSPKMPPVKVFADASLVLPILVGETFAKREAEFKELEEKLHTQMTAHGS